MIGHQLLRKPRPNCKGHSATGRRRNKEELPHQWKESVVPIHKKGDKTECSNYRGISLLPTSYKILSNILFSRPVPYGDEITNVDFDIIGQRPIRSSISVRYWRKKCQYNGTAHQLFIDFKKAYDSVRRKVLYNIPLSLEYPGN
jgi:hypothetical protein